VNYDKTVEPIVLLFLSELEFAFLFPNKNALLDIEYRIIIY
jgi:hypothetical protein